MAQLNRLGNCHQIISKLRIRWSAIRGLLSRSTIKKLPEAIQYDVGFW